MLHSHCTNGKERVGYIRKIREAGSSGIADIFWAGARHPKMLGK